MKRRELGLGFEMVKRSIILFNSPTIEKGATNYVEKKTRERYFDFKERKGREGWNMKPVVRPFRQRPSRSLEKK